MTHALEERPSDWISGLLEPLLGSGDTRTPVAQQSTAMANDLTSVRIQSLAGRGMIDPKSLRLREIQELSASIVAHIRQQHRTK